MHHRLAAATLLTACVSLAVDTFAQTKPAAAPQQQPGKAGAAQSSAPAPSTPATAGTSGTTAPSGAKGTSGTQPLTAVGQPAPVDRGSSNASRDPKSTGRDVRPPAAVTDPRSLEMNAAYQIGPEDLLDISVWKNVELSRVVPVRPDGKVSLPLVNDIQASGLTPTELRDQITTKLSEFIPAPEVSVMVKEVHSRKVAVVGAVKMPGRYEMRSPMTVLEAIALAQGLSDFAARDRIFVMRDVNGKTTQIPFNYRKVGDDQKNFYLRAGDVVVVP